MELKRNFTKLGREACLEYASRNEGNQERKVEQDLPFAWKTTKIKDEKEKESLTQFASCLDIHRNRKWKREKGGKHDFPLAWKASNGSKRRKGEKGAKWDLQPA